MGVDLSPPNLTIQIRKLNCNCGLVALILCITQSCDLTLTLRLDDCEDGDKGTHHSDESIDKIVVRSGRLNDDVSNKTMKVGEYITATATVWAYSLLDSADFFITSDINDPSWVYIDSVNATVAKAIDELSVETIVPTGLVHAVRVNFHYRTDEDITDCLGGSWDDVDDLGKFE